jgi:hypothetical protein
VQNRADRNLQEEHDAEEEELEINEEINEDFDVVQPVPNPIDEEIDVVQPVPNPIDEEIDVVQPVPNPLDSMEVEQIVSLPDPVSAEQIVSLPDPVSAEQIVSLPDPVSAQVVRGIRRYDVDNHGPRETNCAICFEDLHNPDLTAEHSALVGFSEEQRAVFTLPEDDDNGNRVGTINLSYGLLL